MPCEIIYMIIFFMFRASPIKLPQIVCHNIYSTKEFFNIIIRQKINFEKKNENEIKPSLKVKIQKHHHDVSLDKIKEKLILFFFI